MDIVGGAHIARYPSPAVHHKFFSRNQSTTSLRAGVRRGFFPLDYQTSPPRHPAHFNSRERPAGFGKKLGYYGKEMMRMSGLHGGSSGSESDGAAEIEWELRPGGMLVQKRIVDPGTPPPPALCLRVSYGKSKIEISVSSRSTFWELKKLLEAETRLKPSEQRIMYKGKEREMGNPSSCERRYIEMRRNVKIQDAARAISALSLEVDKLATQVKSIEKSISSGNKVPELQITTLIELLMRQAVKLDAIHAEGDASIQKNLQAKSVQKCVEALDVLKQSNGKLNHVIVTTKWETFDPPSTTQWEFFE
ncbi:hypothetical protein HPP92_017139 [Vanilla planifolia]|uniref:Ubiquitin-like domain-containing protein n=1 Tax=Vanilla planifolia TaxID=51239 RepID=A0A835Q7H2_VANPL|nr:hypothetical protein HPP92_017139 [Vanilla planifolia]